MKNAYDLEVSALTAVNKAREVVGKAPLRALPQGYVDNSGDCPIQRALRDIGIGESINVFYTSVSGINKELIEPLTKAWNNPGKKTTKATLRSDEVALPKSIRTFIRAFDRGEINHLCVDDIMPNQASCVVIVSKTMTSVQ
jgi:hypothetical protein